MSTVRVVDPATGRPINVELPTEGRRRLAAGWVYDSANFIAALIAGGCGLRLEALDDLIDALRGSRGNDARNSLQFWEAQRAQLMGLIATQPNHPLTRDKARMIAGLLREAGQRQQVRDLTRRQPPPGERRTVYTAKVPAAARRERIAQATKLRQQGYTLAAIAKKFGVVTRTVERWLADERR